MRAAWAYFVAWPQTANDFAELAKTKLAMPILAISGEKASAGTLTPQMKLVATDVTVVELKGAGHWLMEERQKETIDALMTFLAR
jgi:pimeloyl-ACP methyl ester carboxylesterase